MNYCDRCELRRNCDERAKHKPFCNHFISKERRKEKAKRREEKEYGNDVRNLPSWSPATER